MIEPDMGARGGADEWKEGWKVVASAFIGSTLAAMVFFSHGIFMKPLQQEFGWTRAELTGAAMLFSLSSAIAMILVGQLIGKFGPRRLVLVGWLLAISSFAMLSLIERNLAVYYLVWFFLGITVATSGAITLSACVIPWFSRHRGAAVSIALTGSNAVGALVPLVAATLISELGWRMAYLSLALGALALCYPILLFGFREKHVSPSVRDTPQSGSVSTVDRSHDVDMTLRDAMRSHAFWVFGIGLIVGGSGMTSQVIHFVPMLTDAGASPALAAALLSINSLVAIPVGFSIGFVLDRIGVRWLSPVIACLPAVSALLLWQGRGSVLLAAMAAAAIGFYSGAVIPSLSQFVTRYFGITHYGSIFAILMAAFAVVQGLGAMVVGAIFDKFGSYSPAFAGIAVSGLATALLLTSIGKPPQRISDRKQ
jgi:MFS family permease